MLDLELARLIGMGAERVGEGIAGVVGELEGLEEKVIGRRFFLRRPSTGALPGSSIGVKGVISGVKIVKLFLRLFDMLEDGHTTSCYWSHRDNPLLAKLWEHCEIQ